MAYSKKITETTFSKFYKAYKRTSRRNGLDPNDRHYDRGLEERIKKISPDELSKLMNEDGDEKH
jgi:hypothetical protein